MSYPKNPSYAYGAVYGRNQTQQNIRTTIFVLFTLTWVASLVGCWWGNTAAKNDESFSNLLGYSVAIAILFPIVAIFGGIQTTLGYNQDVFENDTKTLRQKYAVTVFKKWVETTYGMSLTPQQALDLMDGLPAFVKRADTHQPGRTIVVQVWFEFTPTFSKLAEYGRYWVPAEKDWDLKTKKIEFILLQQEKETPKTNPTYVWEPTFVTTP